MTLNGRPAHGRIFVYLTDGSPELAPGSRITFVGVVRPSDRLADGLLWSARQTGPLTGGRILTAILAGAVCTVV